MVEACAISRLWHRSWNDLTRQQANGDWTVLACLRASIGNRKQCGRTPIDRRNHTRLPGAIAVGCFALCSFAPVYGEAVGNASGQQAISRHRLEPGKWQRIPSVSEAASAYPYVASLKRVEGHSVLLCMVLATGRLTKCSIKSENPEGWGFGEAGIKLSEYFRADPSKLTADDLGAPVELPLRWLIPDQ